MKVFLLALAMATLAACGTTANLGSATNSAHTNSTAAANASKLNVLTSARFGKILTDGNGRTLYFFSPEKDGRVACTGGCSQIWRPLLLPAGQQPSSAATLSGKLGSVARPDGGNQVTYNEFPLYTFTGDSKRGDTNGQGIAGKWFVVPATFPQDADRDADGTAPAPAPATKPTIPASAPTAAPVPVPAQPATPTPCNFTQPNFNDGDGDNAGNFSDGDGCG